MKDANAAPTPEPSGEPDKVETSPSFEESSAPSPATSRIVLEGDDRETCPRGIWPATVCDWVIESDAYNEAQQNILVYVLADTPEENVKLWHELPGFFWNYPVTKLRPGATPLLAHPSAKMGDLPMPLLAYQHYGKGQVLFCGFEETWRWRLNTQDKIFGRFWGQVLLYMALPHKLALSAALAELNVDRGALGVHRYFFLGLPRSSGRIADDIDGRCRRRPADHDREP